MKALIPFVILLLAIPRCAAAPMEQQETKIWVKTRQLKENCNLDSSDCAEDRWLCFQPTLKTIYEEPFNDALLDGNEPGYKRVNVQTISGWVPCASK